MIRLFYNKNTALLISVWLLIACQPPEDTSQSAIAQADTMTEDADLSFLVSDETVTLSSDSILNLKSSRYQPSLGLQGEIEPLRQSRFVTAKAVTVQKVLVQQGQWVEEGSPLFILAPQASNEDKTANSAESLPSNNKAEQQADDIASNNINNSINENINDNTSRDSASSDSADNQQAQNIEQAAKQTSPQPALKTQSESQQDTETKAQDATIIVRTSFAGRVNKLPVANGDKLAAGTALLSLADNTHLQFIATLPIQSEPQLSVGQTVNFSTDNNAKKYTGQISKLSVGDNPNQLKVHVQVLKNDASREGGLKVGMIATGRVNYGQIAVGTIVPELAIHDADLSALKRPPYQPLAPLTANVWIIKQDQRLTRQPIEIIEYNPDTEQYLIAGVNNDSLICLADLPVESAGKKVVIS
ncbi:efflux RND transporter periplasmic adaptor subunit [Psychrobacter sp. 1U2]|uniref:efflux RND transporter periplasmic adaptor subunit n=1 Tax=Psychrobacter sp. 1U2 TaxID=3453577 RepID=UPI003F461812